jgi:integrase
MANLGRKAGIFHARFRLAGREYKKSLKTRDPAAAQAALHLVELTLHRIHTGQLGVPPGVDPGEFVVSGGTRTDAAPDHRPSPPPDDPVARPTTRALIDLYVAAQRPLLAPSYHASQAMHLRHLTRFLLAAADQPCDHITYRDLDRYLQHRLGERHPSTAERERVTLLQFYKWGVRQGYLATSPAAGLPPIKGGEDRPPFRTVAEIERLIGRGGLSADEVLGLWECLYLSPSEIAGLLATVRANARVDYSYLLHAVPAYTGMRRGEVLRLRWVDVDLDEGYLTAVSRKQSRRQRETTRRIDLHPELRADLTDWRRLRPRGQYVICDAATCEPISLDRANRCFWQPMRGTAWCLNNSKDWFKIGFHSYRHSFASNLAAAGVDQRVIDELMGHTTEAMRRRYRHLFPQARRAAVTCFSFASPDRAGAPADHGPGGAEGPAVVPPGAHASKGVKHD